MQKIGWRVSGAQMLSGKLSLKQCNPASGNIFLNKIFPDLIGIHIHLAGILLSDSSASS